MAIKRAELIEYLNQLLTPSLYQDYCPNGMQIEGREEISLIVTAVTSSQALLDAAVACGADTILVHHGFFWKGEDSRICGNKKRRIKTILEHNINLLAYHLPLDAHPELGNNVQLANRLGIKITGELSYNKPHGIGNIGEFKQAISAQELANMLNTSLQREPLVITAGDHPIKTLAWCTGAAQGYIEKAIELGVDAYISGEISEPTVHAARENSIHYFAAGHHATERYGVQAVGEKLAKEFAIEHKYIEIDNPV